MIMNKEIDDFVMTVHGIDLREDRESRMIFGDIFKRRNYFMIDDSPCIVKISRTSKTFWGVGRIYVDRFSEFGNFFIILLTTRSQGWIFSKQEVHYFIQSNHWNLREKDQNYKINPPLPDKNYFSSPDRCLRLMRQSSGRN